MGLLFQFSLWLKSYGMVVRPRRQDLGCQSVWLERGLERELEREL